MGMRNTKFACSRCWRMATIKMYVYILHTMTVSTSDNDCFVDMKSNNNEDVRTYNIDFERVIKTYGPDSFRYAVANRNGIYYINFSCQEHLTNPQADESHVSDITWCVEYNTNPSGFDVPYPQRSWFSYVHK